MQIHGLNKEGGGSILGSQSLKENYGVNLPSPCKKSGGVGLYNVMHAEYQNTQSLILPK